MANGEPADFSHLTANERVFVAQERIAHLTAYLDETVQLDERLTSMRENVEVLREMLDHKEALQVIGVLPRPSRE
jgi:hypothetical protein